ncbi:uncharacterized protein PEZ65_021882 [Lycodopsis pacificus]
MAAAASSSSRAVAGGLYILFTLLCLVCLASSRIDDETLKNLKEDNQKIEQVLDNVKAKRAALSEFASKSISSHEAMIAFLEDLIEESSDTFLQQKGHLESNKGLLKNLKTYVDEQNELFDADMADIELKLGKSKKCLRALEEFQAEL